MIKKHVIRAAVVAACIFASAASHADTRRVIQGQFYEQQKLLQEQLQRQESTKPEEPAAVKGVPHPSVVQQGKDSPPFVLKQLVFSSSGVFSPQELEEFSHHLLNTEVTLQKLRYFATSLERHYIAKGYIARVILPPQKIRDGVVAIRMIEARVGDVKLTQNQNTRASFINRRLDVPSGGELLNIHQLEQGLININNVYDINLSAQLQPGQEFASSDIVMAVSEPKLHQLNLILDNNGDESTGEFRQQLAYSNASLSGRRDRLDANIRNSEGSTDGALAYSFYWPDSSIRTMLFYADSEMEIVDGPVSDLGVNGDSSVMLLDISKPVYVTSDRGLTLRASLDRADSTTNIDAVELEHTTTDTAKIGMGYWRRQGRLYWTTNVALGLHKTSGEFSSTQVSDLEYATLNGGGFIYYDMGNPYSWHARGNYQFSDEDQLPSSGEFQIGGLGSIRGYDSGVLSGYQGYHFSVELHRNWDTGAWQDGSRMDGYIFLDNGQVDPGDSRRDDTLTGIGFGMDWRMRQGIKFSAAVAWAATELEEEDEDTSIHLNIDIPLLTLW